MTLWKARIASRFRLDPDGFRAIMGARKEYLEKAFDAHYGSIDNYFAVALDLDQTKREQLRQIFLE